MATSTVRDTLEKMESLLGITVGVVKMVEMTPVEFCSYAHGEVAKATAEGGAASTRRLKALLTAVSVFKDNYVDGESESVKVPVTVNESTALDEKQNQLMDPLTVGNSNKGGQSAFSQGFVAKIHDLKKLVDSLKAEGADGKLPEDGEETEGLKDEAKAKKAEGNEEETEKAKGKPFPGAAKPFGKPDDEEKAKKADDEEEEKSKAKKVGEDAEEGDDAAGHTAEAGMADKKKTAKVSKGMRGVDVSKDGTAWPSDLNDPSFLKDGTVQKSLDWGRD